MCREFSFLFFDLVEGEQVYDFEFQSEKKFSGHEGVGCIVLCRFKARDETKSAAGVG